LDSLSAFSPSVGQSDGLTGSNGNKKREYNLQKNIPKCDNPRNLGDSEKKSLEHQALAAM
jgi:hypothetical protein